MTYIKEKNIRDTGKPLKYWQKERKCVICGKKFIPDFRPQKCCCTKCSKINMGHITYQWHYGERGYKKYEQKRTTAL